MRQLWLGTAGEVVPKSIPSNFSQQEFFEDLKQARNFLFGWGRVANSKACQVCSGPDSPGVCWSGGKCKECENHCCQLFHITQEGRNPDMYVNLPRFCIRAQVFINHCEG